MQLELVHCVVASPKPNYAAIQEILDPWNVRHESGYGIKFVIDTTVD